MKVRPFRAPRFLLSGVAQSRRVLRGAVQLARRRWLVFYAGAIFSTLLLLFLLRYDARILASMHFSHFGRSESTMHVAAFLGTWGDYPTYNFPLALILWIYGCWTKSRAWRRAAVICFLGATLAGLFDDIFRLTLGRPRPDAHMLDGFYGLHDAWHSRFQSFPSGHAAAVFGTAASLLLTRPLLGSLATAYALVVIWARMELYRHYPSDVLVGSLIGIYFGWLVARGSTVQLKAAPPTAP